MAEKKAKKTAKKKPSTAKKNVDNNQTKKTVKTSKKTEPKTPVKRKTTTKTKDATKTAKKVTEKTEEKKAEKKKTTKKPSPKKQDETKKKGKKTVKKTDGAPKDTSKETKKRSTSKKKKKDTKEKSSKKITRKKIETRSPAEQKALDDVKKVLGERYLPVGLIDELVSIIVEKKISSKKIETIVNRVVEDYLANAIDPSEACGIVGAQSIGEPGTQMSVPHDEKIIIKQDQRIRICEIGEFVDSVMQNHTVNNIHKSEVCDLSPNEGIYVPSLNQNEKIEWKKIISCSRHKSPQRLLRLKTRSGRTIRATDAHSFVIRSNNEIIPIAGKDLTVGDRIPVVKRLKENCVHVLDLGNYLQISTLDHAFEKDELIYPCPSKRPLPKNMRLSYSVGWFTGAYLAEGNATKYYTSISNIDEKFLSNVRRFAKEYDLTYDEYDNNRGFSKGHDIRINSSLLSMFMKKSCNTGSHEKKVPDFAFSANQDYVCGLLKGYFDADGSISVERKCIRASSSSKALIDGIALLLNRLGIFCSKHTKGNEHQLRISYHYAPVFLEKIGSDINKKNEKLVTLHNLASVHHKSYDIVDMIPGFGDVFVRIAKKIGFPKRLVNNFTKRQRIGRTTLSTYLQEFETISNEKGVDIKDELTILRNMLNSDVIWDEIRDISFVEPLDEYVYDLSVDGLETFTTFDGVITHNTMRTFHYAGVAEINVTLGLPRLIEIVDARSAPSTPMMNIYLLEEFRNDASKAKIVANMIEITQLHDIAEIETDLTNLLIKIKFDHESLKNKGLSVKQVSEVLKKIRKISVSENKDKSLTVSMDKPSFKKLLDITEKLKTLKVKGVDGIERIIIRKEPAEGYVIYSEGSNLEQVLDIEGVDQYRTSTNDIQAVGRVLGIEAARNMIIQEAHNTLSEQGLTVDKRHIMLVADVMTSDGKIKAIGRHGVSGEKTSVLSRAAFEITVNHLLQASRRGESDLLEGVAENIIVGQPVNLGTGAVELAMKRIKVQKKNGEK
jgi:DNA-directed RNA polymerase subunit A"